MSIFYGEAEKNKHTQRTLQVQFHFFNWSQYLQGFR